MEDTNDISYSYLIWSKHNIQFIKREEKGSKMINLSLKIKETENFILINFKRFAVL